MSSLIKKDRNLFDLFSSKKETENKTIGNKKQKVEKERGVTIFGIISLLFMSLAVFFSIKYVAFPFLDAKYELYYNILTPILLFLLVVFVITEPSYKDNDDEEDYTEEEEEDDDDWEDDEEEDEDE